MRLTITIENKELVIRRSEKSGQTTILHTEIDRARMEEVSAAIVDYCTSRRIPK